MTWADRTRRRIVAALSTRRSARRPTRRAVADLVADKGHINVAADAAEIGPAIERLKPLPGYRWIAINAGDLFAASPKTLGTKVGIMDATGRVLKAADLPRPK